MVPGVFVEVLCGNDRGPCFLKVLHRNTVSLAENDDTPNVKEKKQKK